MAVENLAHMLIVRKALCRKWSSVTEVLTAICIVGDVIMLISSPNDRCQKLHVLVVRAFVGPLLDAPTNIL